MEGLSNLAIELIRLETSDGQKHSVATNLYEVQGGPGGQKFGAATAIGSIIGAVTGAARGAAIGAAAGAGASGGLAVGTRSKDAVIAAESRLLFYLRVPLDFAERDKTAVRAGSATFANGGRE